MSKYHLQGIVIRCLPCIFVTMFRQSISCFLFILFGSIGFHAHAQDPEYSQLFSNRLHINPAFAGANKGLRMSLIHRQIWPNVPGPFNTSGFGLDINAPVLNGAIALTAMKDERGEGFIKTTKFGLTYAYRNLLGKRGNTEFSLATTINMVSKSIDWTRFEFSDQFDPYYGKIYQTSAAQPGNTVLFYPDFDFGFTMNHRLRLPNKEMYIGWGGATHHLFRPDESFLGIPHRLPRKVSGYLAAMIPLQHALSKVPTFLFPHIYYGKQGKQSDLSTDVKFQNFMAGCMFYKEWYFIGLDYRNSPYTPAQNTDAFILTLGADGGFGEGGSYQIAYSFDFNLNGLSNRTWGSHEISVVVALDNFRLANLRGGSGSRKKINCFDFPHRGVFRVF